MNNTEKMQQLLSHAHADINLCAAALSLITEAPEEEQVSLFKMALIGFRAEPTDESWNLITEITDQEKERLEGRYGNIIDAYFEYLIRQDLPEDEFYAVLWRYISTASELENDKVRAYALFDLAIDRRIPYYHMGRASAVRMGDNEFCAMNDLIGNEVFSRMVNILDSDLQKTEKASILLRMADEYDSIEMKSVLMAFIFSYYEGRERNLVEQLQSMANERH